MWPCIPVPNRIQIKALVLTTLVIWNHKNNHLNISCPSPQLIHKWDTKLLVRTIRMEPTLHKYNQLLSRNWYKVLRCKKNGILLIDSYRIIKHPLKSTPPTPRPTSWFEMYFFYLESTEFDRSFFVMFLCLLILQRI